MPAMAVRKPTPAAGLACIVVVSALARFFLARPIPTPWIAPDEMLYALLGRDLYEHGRLGVLGHGVGFYSLVYPAIAGLPLSLHDVKLGYTLLKAMELSELAGHDEASYVEIAAALAADQERLGQLRLTLRERMAASPLRDEAGFTRELEAAYRSMWRAWCLG